MTDTRLYRLPPPSSSTGLGGTPGLLHDILVILGVGLGLLALLLIWARFIRRRSRQHSDLRVAPHVLEEAGVADESDRHHHRPHRRRRREHRPRNPTLSQTGGLPPPRAQNESPLSL